MSETHAEPGLVRGDSSSPRGGGCGGSESTQGTAATQNFARNGYLEGWEREGVSVGAGLGMGERKARDVETVANP